MRKSISLSFCLLVLFNVVSCGNVKNASEQVAVDQDCLYGCWTMPLSGDFISGEERFCFEAPDRLELSDAIIFEGEDNGFNFTMPVRLCIAGRWFLRGDSLFILYEAQDVKLECDRGNIRIGYDESHGNKQAFDMLQNEMAATLISSLAQPMSDNYMALAGEELYLGDIVVECSDSIVMVKNDLRAPLRRVK